MNLPFNLLQIFPPLLFFISLFGLITSRNVIKSIAFSLLMQTAVIIFWLSVGAAHGTTPPMIQDGAMLYNLEGFSDPLPQALMLTAIVIGISITAINITMLNTLFRKYRSTDWGTLAKETKKEEEF